MYYLTKKGWNSLLQRIADPEVRVRTIQASSAEAAEVGGNQYHDNSSYEMLKGAGTPKLRHGVNLV